MLLTYGQNLSTYPYRNMDNGPHYRALNQVLNVMISMRYKQVGRAGFEPAASD